ncbi:hypothetical protein B0H13DRAFT_2546203 [Mycena leptocephala]|nr:hypothetical protein B0H13DRAFT_2546203 [Mycena leptocephala]
MYNRFHQEWSALLFNVSQAFVVLFLFSLRTLHRRQPTRSRFLLVTAWAIFLFATITTVLALITTSLGLQLLLVLEETPSDLAAALHLVEVHNALIRAQGFLLATNNRFGFRACPSRSVCSELNEVEAVSYLYDLGIAEENSHSAWDFGLGDPSRWLHWLAEYGISVGRHRFVPQVYFENGMTLRLLSLLFWVVTYSVPSVSVSVSPLHWGHYVLASRTKQADIFESVAQGLVNQGVVPLAGSMGNRSKRHPAVNNISEREAHDDVLYISSKDVEG